MNFSVFSRVDSSVQTSSLWRKSCRILAFNWKNEASVCQKEKKIIRRSCCFLSVGADSEFWWQEAAGRSWLAPCESIKADRCVIGWGRERWHLIGCSLKSCPRTTSDVKFSKVSARRGADAGHFLPRRVTSCHSAASPCLPEQLRFASSSQLRGSNGANGLNADRRNRFSDWFCDLN